MYKIAISLAAIILTAFGGLGAVVLNEVDLAPSDNYVPNWVEVYNSGPDVVDISGWQILVVDNPWRGTIDIAQGTVIPAGGHYVFDGDCRWVHGNGGVVILTDAGGLEVDRTPMLLDNRTDEFTWSRLPDGRDTGRKSDWAYVRATRGFENTQFY